MRPLLVLLVLGFFAFTAKAQSVTVTDQTDETNRSSTTEIVNNPADRMIPVYRKVDDTQIRTGDVSAPVTDDDRMKPVKRDPNVLSPAVTREPVIIQEEHFDKNKPSTRVKP